MPSFLGRASIVTMGLVITSAINDMLNVSGVKPACILNYAASIMDPKILRLPPALAPDLGSEFFSKNCFRSQTLYPIQYLISDKEYKEYKDNMELKEGDYILNASVAFAVGCIFIWALMKFPQVTKKPSTGEAKTKQQEVTQKTSSNPAPKSGTNTVSLIANSSALNNNNSNTTTSSVGNYDDLLAFSFNEMNKGGDFVARRNRETEILPDGTRQEVEKLVGSAGNLTLSSIKATRTSADGIIRIFEDDSIASGKTAKGAALTMSKKLKLSLEDLDEDFGIQGASNLNNSRPATLSLEGPADGNKAISSTEEGDNES